MFKSSTHGTCALGGRHTSEKYAAECPVLGRTREERLLRVAEEGAAITLQGRPEGALSSPEDSSGSNTVFRHGRAGKSGRPRVTGIEQRRKARERTRAYRDRKKLEG
jgi:hypothetical protein